MDSVHKTVLLKETIDGLNLKPGSVVIDATFGGGGHCEEICKRYPGTKIIALDQDREALERGKKKFENLGCDITFVNTNFRELQNLKNFYPYDGIANLSNLSINSIIFDLGLSSDQLENSLRGFSFLRDEPLLMTMKENPGPEDLTAKEIVNTWDEENIAQIIYGYGEEKYSRRIARGIVEERSKRKIETTFDLVKIIEGVVPGIYKRANKIHFATRTFQALRIAVNDELGALRKGIEGGFDLLNKGGRMAVITFHSLEDRIVKKFYKERVSEKKGVLINKKPIVAGAEELKNNGRARSAKLRTIEKI